MRASIIFIMIVIAILLIPSVQAMEEYSKLTGADCTTCHPGYPDNYELGPAGEYFREHGTLEGYGVPPQETPEPGARCNSCHGRMEVNYTPRELVYAPENHRFDLKHGDGRFWCLTCHDPADRTKLKLFNGSRIPLENPILLCSQCHGPVYEEWKDHIHGRWGKNVFDAEPTLICTDCHNPHDPAFKPISPMPTPQYEPEPVEPSWYNPVAGFILVVSALLIVASVRR